MYINNNNKGIKGLGAYAIEQRQRTKHTVMQGRLQGK